MNFQIILRNGESLDISCGPGIGRSTTFTLSPKQALIVRCGNSSLFIQCQPGNVEQTFELVLDKNQTVTVTCNK
ncbi:hypothetical protein [Bacillus sp. REN10]|uniref:hypothetical protein n=1 Tax=Bacillus sp. REN10 TaxID=2782541 RepID=UPI00193BE230|nr:hypothetical protein [Bacillus sp. REN10]